MARVRSPNYPAISLPSAVERIKTLHKAEGKNAMAREALVQHLGFSGINGASATLVSALSKYGLIESVGTGEARISDLGMRLIYPHDATERQAAVEDAAFRPALFLEIKEKWPDRPPSDESLRPYLVRKGFSEGALDQVIRFYRDTIDMVQAGAQVQAPSSDGRAKEAPMQSGSPAAPSPVAAPAISGAPLNGKAFSIAFDGAVLTGALALKSVRDIDRLMKVLRAQKAAFEAMEDDEDDVTPVESEDSESE
ncbi:hypothetical protein [uncultured Methylobacterium sp.]|uniref:hypothetical protein n=1 Tax=uncultured Methylobacterium sp. TaxID=157278 RepID=UPI0035CBF298